MKTAGGLIRKQAYVRPEDEELLIGEQERRRLAGLDSSESAIFRYLIRRHLKPVNSQPLQSSS
jgi:hypothetical protein